LATAGILLGSLGFAACLWMTFASMTDVIVNNGGICAAGGPYPVAPGHVCSQGGMVLIGIGGPGLFIFGAIAIISVIGLLGVRGGIHLLLLSTLVFGLLGWNFLHLRANGHDADSGSLLCGVMFLLMAAAGPVAIVLILARQRRADAEARKRSARRAGGQSPPVATARLELYGAAFVVGTVVGVFLGRAIVSSVL